MRKHDVFVEISTKLDKPPIGHKLIFTRKLDSQGQVLRFKVRLVAQGFTQRPEVDFDETYSHINDIMDCVSFRYVLAITVHIALKIYLMDVVTAYLHGTLDSTLHIRFPPGFLESEPKLNPGRFVGLWICKALYGLKQSGRVCTITSAITSFHKVSYITPHYLAFSLIMQILDLSYWLFMWTI